MSKTTIRDVAEAAGVSAMAVSAVLNGTGRNVKVSKQKADHIRKVAEELRYQPNHLARSLRNRRTMMVGVVFQHLDRLGEERPYIPQLLNGVMSALFPANYTLALCPKMILDGHAGTISDGRFDGVLWCRPDFTGDSLPVIQNSSVPVVMMHAPPGSVPGIATFCANNDSAMHLVVRHLVDLGHRRLAFVVDPVSGPTAEGLARQSAFLRAAEEQGIQGEALVWSQGGDEVAAYRNGGPHTALVCFSDTLAGQILDASWRHGVRVPDHVSVVGFDSSSFCDRTRPRLTSVSQPVERMASDATNHLLALIAGQAPLEPSARIYECGLDLRESTAPPIAP